MKGQFKKLVFSLCATRKTCRDIWVRNPAILVGVLVAGILMGGFLVNPFGRKRLMVTSAFTAVISVVLFYVIMFVVPNLWLHLGLGLVGTFLGGFVFAASPNLAVEQIPDYRGTMMSLGQGLGNIGRASGVFIAGAILTLLSNTIGGYTAAIVALAGIGLSGTLVLVFFAGDPCNSF